MDCTASPRARRPQKSKDAGAHAKPYHATKKHLLFKQKTLPSTATLQA